MKESKLPKMTDKDLKAKGFQVTSIVVKGKLYRIVIPLKEQHMEAAIQIAKDLTKKMQVEHIAAKSIPAAMSVIIGRK